jgi:hypothetical protein
MAEEKSGEGPAPTVVPADLWKIIIRDIQASSVVWGVAQLDYRIGRLLENSMPNLSNTLGAKLFEGMGALSRFSARIDVAYAFALIDDKLRADLHAFRLLRNAFAHSPISLHFTDEEPLSHLSKFDNYKADIDPLSVFMAKHTECSDKLQKLNEHAASVKALKDYTATHGSLLAPSPAPSPLPNPPSPGDSGTSGGAPPRSSPG